MRTFLTSLGQQLFAGRSLAWDLAGLAGAALATLGIWQIYRPLAFIVAGGLILFVAIRGAAVQAAREEKRQREAR